MRKFTLLLVCIGFSQLLKAQFETEPNNNCVTSNKVQINQWFLARMADTLGRSDWDYFQLELNNPGQYLIEFNSDTTGILPYLILSGFNSCENLSVGVAPDIDSNYINPVFYFLVNDPGTLFFYFKKKKTGELNYNYKFRIIRISLDSYEPDNTVARSNSIQIGDTVNAFFNGYTLGSNSLSAYSEVDWYRVQISEKGIIFPRLIEVPQDKSPQVLIFNFDSILLAKNCCNLAGVSMECLQQLICDPGIYYIRVSFKDTIPAYKRIDIPRAYKMIVNFIPDSTECNQNLSTATPLFLGRTYNAYLGGDCGISRDIDIYKIQTENPGNLILDIWDMDSTSEKYIYFLDKDSFLIFSGYYYAHYYISFSRQNENAHLYFLCSTDPYYIVIEERATGNCQNPRLFSPYQIRVNVNTEDTTECNNLALETRLVPCQSQISAVLDPAYDIDRFWVRVLKGDTIHFKLDFNSQSKFLELVLMDRNSGKIYRSQNIYESGIISFYNIYESEEFIISIRRRNPLFEQEPMPYTLEVLCPERSTSTSDKSIFEMYFYPVGHNLYCLSSSDFGIFVKDQPPLVYNISGQKLLLPVEKISNGWLVDLENLPNGIYFIHFRLNDKLFIKKFLL